MLISCWHNNKNSISIKKKTETLSRRVNIIFPRVSLFHRIKNYTVDDDDVAVVTLKNVPS
jgi:hypothetical protein